MKIKFKHIRLGLIAVLALIFIFSAVQLVRILAGYRQGANEYNEAAGLAGLPDLSGLPTLTPGGQPNAQDPSSTDIPGDTMPGLTPAPYVDPYADALRDMDFTALREVNSDVLGWILIPDTIVSYPFLQGSDNNYYLDHTWQKTYNSVGAIFMEQANHADFSDFNTILYGHRMNNNSMFGVLHRYTDQSYWAAHPYVYITDDSGSRRYDIFAAYEVVTTGATYRLGFSNDTDKQDFLDFCLAQSVIDTGVTPSVYDSILTLSTCTGSGHETRWVVQAACRNDPPVQEEDPPVQTQDPGTSEPPEPETSGQESEAPAREPDSPDEESPAEEP